MSEELNYPVIQKEIHNDCNDRLGSTGSEHKGATILFLCSTILQRRITNEFHLLTSVFVTTVVCELKEKLCRNEINVKKYILYDSWGGKIAVLQK